jgi:hypothetical protein
MIISKDKDGCSIGWRETYVSDREIVNVALKPRHSTLHYKVLDSLRPT